MASVPQPKKGEAPQPQPTSTGLLAICLAGRRPAEQSAEPAAALRGTDTEMAAKRKRAAPVRTASTPAVPHPKTHEAAPPKPDAVVNNAPALAPAPPVQQARDDQKTPTSTPKMRTAYRLPGEQQRGADGAQPVVPAGSFESCWAAPR